jgi:hypothetical protein
MEVKLTRLAHKIAIQMHLVAERCNICSSRSRRPVPKLLDTLSYIYMLFTFTVCNAIKMKERQFVLVHLHLYPVVKKLLIDEKAVLKPLF